MEREKLFSKGGYYTFIVESNVLAHQEVMDHVARLISERFIDRKMPIKVLDLACGGEPITIAEAMKRNEGLKFTYTGIDINTDQVEKATHWPHYPVNVIQVSITQGNAWDLKSLQLDGTFDIIFSGLNFHHATPEELYFLTRELNHYLAQDGILINHDMYRPNDEPYLRRPDLNPKDPNEPYFLVDPKNLVRARIPQLHIQGDLFGSHQYDWRDTFFKKYTRVLEEKGADKTGMAETFTHIYERDFPVSTAEIEQILALTGYCSTVYSFAATSQPIGEYLALVTATKR